MYTVLYTWRHGYEHIVQQLCLVKDVGELITTTTTLGSTFDILYLKSTEKESSFSVSFNYLQNAHKKNLLKELSQQEIHPTMKSITDLFKPLILSQCI